MDFCSLVQCFDILIKFFFLTLQHFFTCNIPVSYIYILTIFITQIFFSFLYLYHFSLLDLYLIPYNPLFFQFPLLLQPSYLVTAIYGHCNLPRILCLQMCDIYTSNCCYILSTSVFSISPDTVLSAIPPY